jgi:hypothetical protein
MLEQLLSSFDKFACLNVQFVKQRAVAEGHCLAVYGTNHSLAGIRAKVLPTT